MFRDLTEKYNATRKDIIKMTAPTIKPMDITLEKPPTKNHGSQRFFERCREKNRVLRAGAPDNLPCLPLSNPTDSVPDLCLTFTTMSLMSDLAQNKNNPK